MPKDGVGNTPTIEHHVEVGAAHAAVLNSDQRSSVIGNRCVDGGDLQLAAAAVDRRVHRWRNPNPVCHEFSFAQTGRVNRPWDDADMVTSDPIDVLVASEIITMDPQQPRAEAVAVQGDRILAVGSLAEVVAVIGDESYRLDETHRDDVILPGLIDQHLHPFLGATTLTTEVIAIEDWNLPDKFFPAANSETEYRARLAAADAALDDSQEWLFSWGYHSLWHGVLDRAVLDEISVTRPIGVWQRSCHEFYLNSAAIDLLGLTDEMVADSSHAATISLERGHFWENGLMAFLMPHLTPHFVTLDRLVNGLEQMISYLHTNGVTAFNEPGAVLPPGAWDLYTAILGRDDVPLLSSFIVDARGPAAAGIPFDAALKRAERMIAESSEGKVAFLPDQVKLFADGAIISQLMQMKEPYLDAEGQPNPAHHGEWLMTPELFEELSKSYWDAGYQLHVHVNGDLGLEMVLDALERRLAETPRDDHRTVIVHFANSTEEQVDRIAALGAIVSSNPYYPVGFADKYGEVGLGPERADVMTRNQSVLDRGINLSFHSDLPMGPADPLGMMSCAVNRVTQSGRVAGPEQRVAAEDALRAVTINAAQSWRREDEIGSIEPGKLANFTVVDEDPLAVDPMSLDRIAVRGTVFGGRWFPVSPERQAARLFRGGLVVALSPSIDDADHHGCACAVARQLMELFVESQAA
jgi:predicted amidohydrolase YtcJ